MFRWGDDLRIIAVQDYRRRLLFGSNNPPIIEEVTPVRYITLEIIGKGRWEGFMQADFQKYYGIDPRTSFHHIKVLVKLHLVTKQVRYYQNVYVQVQVRFFPIDHHIWLDTVEQVR